MKPPLIPHFMKISIVLPLFLSALPALALSVDSNNIHSVQIHPNGVSVMRHIVVGSERGGNTVEVVDLPSRLDPSSLRILAPADRPFRIGGFDFSPDERKVAPLDSRTQDLREVLKALERKNADAQNELNTLDGRLKQYLELANSVRTALANDAEASVLELGIAAWEKYEQVKGEVEVRKREINEALATMTAQREDAHRALEKRVAELSALSGVLRFTVNGPIPEATPIMLHYQLADAGWRPVYEVRASPADGTVEWVYKARLWQRTGEDWEGVKVSLNSASAFDPSGLPELRSIFLDRAGGNYKLDSRAVSAPALMEAPPPPGEALRESTTTGFFATLPEPVSLESGAPASVRTAFEAALPATFWSEATPELSTNAWLVAGLTNALGWPVLSGEAYFFIDGQLVSRRPMPAVPSGEDFELALGRNENIGIERKERLRKESTSGLIDKTRRHEIKYETTVHNRMTIAHRIVLRDRFPVSRNNKIQVDPKSPSEVEVEEGTGLFKWERSVNPNETVVLKTEYTVTYPMEWDVYPKL